MTLLDQQARAARRAPGNFLFARSLARVRLLIGHFTLLALILCLPGSASDPTSNASRRIQAFQTGNATTRASGELRRGMNFGDAMDAPNEGDWGWKLSARDFRVIQNAGFDHVRVPMRISSHAEEEPPYQIKADFLRRMDWVIDQALSNGLGVVIDMHHYGGLMQSPRAHADRLVALWRQIALRYRGMPSALFYEILNEPNGNLTAKVWNDLLARVVREIRAIDPSRALIIEGVHWASATDLRDTLKVPMGDSNLIGSFHMYDPMFFTHQGTDWARPYYNTLGVIFPGPPQKPLVPSAAALEFADSRTFFERYNTDPLEQNPGGPSVIIEQLDIAKAFAARTGLRVYLGEFGANVNADLDSRVRWTRLVRQEAEKRGFGWAYWEFCRKFAAYTPCGARGNWIQSLKAALVEKRSVRDD